MAVSLEECVPQSSKICIHCGKKYGPDGKWPGNFKRSKVCGTECMHARKRYTPAMSLASFWMRVKEGAATGCWNYMGARDKWGYGDVQYERKHVQAHRLAWKLLRGDPGTLDVLHRCNKPPCCNPEHLYLGTDFDNAQDRLRAGTVLRGEQAPRSKVTAEQVKEIRRLRAERKLTYYELGPMFGLSYTQARAICLRIAWGHLE